MTPAHLARIHATAFVAARPWTEAEFTDLLARPGTVLTQTGAAFVLGQVLFDEAEILTLACDPAHQRQGHAKRALALFLARAAEAGARQVFLDVAADNLSAKALYAGFGFSQTGLRRGYFRTISGQPIDALILSKALCPVNPVTDPASDALTLRD